MEVNGREMKIEYIKGRDVTSSFIIISNWVLGWFLGQGFHHLGFFMIDTLHNDGTGRTDG